MKFLPAQYNYAYRHHDKNNSFLGDSMAQRFAYLLPDPAAQGSIPSVPKNVNVAGMNRTAQRNMDSGLKM